MRSIVEHRSRSAEAAENHVSWLDNLRKEISQFPHAATGAGLGTGTGPDVVGSALGSGTAVDSAGAGGVLLPSQAHGKVLEGAGGSGSDSYRTTQAVYRV